MIRSSTIAQLLLSVSKPEMDSLYEVLTQVLEYKEEIELLANIDLTSIADTITEAMDFEGITVVSGDTAEWDPKTKVLTIPTVKGDTGEIGPKGDKGDIGPTGIGVNHISQTSTTDVQGIFGNYGEVDTYTLWGDSEKTINLGSFSVQNGDDIYSAAVSNGYPGTAEDFYLLLSKLNSLETWYNETLVFRNEAEDQANTAKSYKEEAINSAILAANSKTQTESFATLALDYKNSAEDTLNNTIAIKDQTEQYKEEAEETANNSLNYANLAEQSNISAFNHLTAIEQIYDTYDDRYLGAYSTDPTTDNDGDALSVGAMYLNSVTGNLKFWNGSSWEDPEFTTSQNAVISGNKAEEASNSANAALLSEQNAKESENNSLTNANSALLSKNTSEVNANLAVESKNSAKLSEDNAKISETQAALSKNSAEEFANSALESKNNVSSIEQNIILIKTTAEELENSTIDAKDKAVSAKNEAVTAKNLAESFKDASENAKTLAEEFKNSALLSETNSKASEDTAELHKNNAALSANQASLSETNAENSKVFAENYWNNFNTRYLGAYSSPPTKDNNGNDLVIGVTYWNTSVSKLYAWNGTEWSLSSFDSNDSVFLDSVDTLTNKTLIDISNFIGANYTHYKVKNTSEILLTKGTIISSNNTQVGTVLEVVPATNGSVALGVVAEDIEVNEVGLVIVSGTISQINTSSFSTGDILYPSDNGLFTSVKNTGSLIQPCAVVTRSHSNQGTLLLNFSYPIYDSGSVNDFENSLA